MAPKPEKQNRKHKGIHWPSLFSKGEKQKPESIDQNQSKPEASDQGGISQPESSPPGILDDNIGNERQCSGSETALDTSSVISLPSPPDLWQYALRKAQESHDWKENQDQYDEAFQYIQSLNQSLLENSNHQRDGGLATAIATHIHSLQEEHKDKQWAYEKADGEKIYFRDVLSRIARWAGVFKDLGGQLADLDPTNAASLVWGFVQFFVERSTIYNETRDLALDQEPIANMISRYALIEKSYLNSRPCQPTEIHQNVQKTITELYSEIILYQLAVYKFWKQGKITHGIQSLVPHKLKDLSNAIQEKSTKIDSDLRLIDRELLQKILDSVQLKEPIAAVGCQLQQVLKIVTNLEDSKYAEVLKWVSPVLYSDHHAVIEPMEGTGKWLLEHPECLSWRESQSSNLFWLRGKMGAGKTNLVSTLISHLQVAASGSDDQERVAFFYIDNANRVNETKSVEYILNAILKQLVIQGKNGLMQPVVAKFDELHNHSSLHQDDCIGLITSIVKEYRQTNIVIDAIDELEDTDVQADLLAALKQIVNESASALIKIFISSRDHVSIANIMNETWNTRKGIIIEENNQEDIETFITTRVQLLDKPPSRRIPDSVKMDVESVLKERANGMFLWVHLSLEYLRKLKVKNPDTFVDKLNSAPSTIQELYSEILATMVKHQDSEDSGMIQRILAFLVYGRNKEIFKSDTFLTAINHDPDGGESNLSAEDVLDLCSTFVELDTRTDKFRLIHFSVKEFLQTRPEYQSEAAHSLLAIHCLSYLQPGRGEWEFSFFSMRSARSSFKEYSFRDYASEAWIFHCAGAGTSRLNSPLANIMQVFLWGDYSAKPGFDVWVEYLSFFNSSELLLRPIVRGNLDALVVDSKPTPFFLACQYGLQEVVEVLLDKGWNINQPIGNGTGLSLACSQGNFNLASYLIQRGATVAIGTLAPKVTGRGFLWDWDRVDVPLVAAMESGDPKIIELLLSQKGPMPFQAAMESLLSNRNKNQRLLTISSSMARPMAFWDRPIDIMLARFPDFEYSANVQKGMFQGGSKLTKKLLVRNCSLHVTDETLEHLFLYVTTAQNAKDIIQCLLPLSDFVASKAFIYALKFFDQGKEEGALELMEYTLKLNRSSLAISTIEEALHAAITNDWRYTLFTKALLRLNKSFKVSDDLILWTLRNSRYPEGVIDLFLQHDPTPRSISQSEVKGLLVPEPGVCKMLALLVSSSPDLEVDQELFIMAVNDPNSRHEDLELLLGRAPNVVLSEKLINAVCYTASDWAVSQVAVFTQPQEITDDVLRAAVEHWYTCPKFAVTIVSQTLKEVIRKAPDDLKLSEKTYRAAFSSDPWVCHQVLQRWPSELVVAAGLQSASGFQLLIEAMPSIEISSESILSLCQDGSHESSAKTVKGILAFQPHTVITEDMLFAVAETSDYDETKIELLQTFLQHDPHVDITKRVIERVMMSKRHATGMLEVILNDRPPLELNPLSLSMCTYYYSTPFEKYKETLNLAMKRSQGYPLDEMEMLDMMAMCTPDGLGVVLSARPDAVVTDRVIEQLVNNRTNNWEYGCENESFDMLMDRAGMSETERQAWKLRFPSMKVLESP